MRGAFGIENGDYDPESEFERVCGLRMQSFEPRKAVRDGLRGAVGLRYRNTDPARPSRRANGLGKADSEPEGVDAETITGEQKPKPPAGLEFPGQNHYLSSINQIFYTSERYAEADMASQVRMASQPP